MRRKKKIVLCLVILTIVSICGCEEKTKQVNEKNMDIGNIVFTPLNPKIFEEIRFNISDFKNFDVKSLEFNWNFGDGSENEYNSSAKHKYSESGVYHVTLAVSDEVYSVDKYVEVSVDGLISSCDVDFNQPGGWNIKARNFNTSSFEYRIKVTGINNFFIILYNSSSDIYYNTMEGSGIWFEHDKGEENYSLISDTYTATVNNICTRLKGRVIGDNFTEYDEDSEINIVVNDLNCVFSDDLFIPPSGAEIKKVE